MKKLSSNDLFWTFIRSNFLQGSWNMERMQALGFCFGMVPIINHFLGPSHQVKSKSGKQKTG